MADRRDRLRSAAARGRIALAPIAGRDYRRPRLEAARPRAVARVSTAGRLNGNDPALGIAPDRSHLAGVRVGRIQPVLLPAATGLALGGTVARAVGGGASRGATRGAGRAEGGAAVSAVRVQCPGCGAAVVFEVGTGAVAVCPYCRTAVARGDRDVEDLGKVAAVVDTGSVLKVGLEGRYDGVKFRLAGRTQMRHALGGVWDEWHAALADNRWGWFAEAQGRFYLTFEQPLPPDFAAPDFNTLEIDQRLTLPGTSAPFVVAEKGIAAIAAAEGELPWRPDLGGQYPYADLSAEGGAFATLDYSGDGPPTLYLGRQVTLDELRVPKTAHRETWELRSVQGKKLDCPKCGGSLDIRVPDKTERVGCPYCGALLEATEGKLRFLTKPAKLTQELDIRIPLGTVGRIGDAERTVICFLRRSVTFDGVD